MKNFPIKTITAMLLFDIFIGGVFAYWALWPYEPLVFNVSTYSILNENKIVHRGEPLVFMSDSCRNFVGEIHIHRAFIDGIIFNTPDITFYQSEPGCVRYLNTDVVVPHTLPPGKYKLKIQDIIQVNPIRSVVAEIYTEEFLVL